MNIRWIFIASRVGGDAPFKGLRAAVGIRLNIIYLCFFIFPNERIDLNIPTTFNIRKYKNINI